MPVLRPDHLIEAGYAAVLAAADVNLSDLPACRACLVREFGTEPEIDWLGVRTRAVDLRIEAAHGAALAELQGERVALAAATEIAADRIARIEARAAAQTSPAPPATER